MTFRRKLAYVSAALMVPTAIAIVLLFHNVAASRTTELRITTSRGTLYIVAAHKRLDVYHFTSHTTTSGSPVRFASRSRAKYGHPRVLYALAAHEAVFDVAGNLIGMRPVESPTFFHEIDWRWFLLAALAWPAIWFPIAIFVRVRRRPGYCPQCGYDLHGTIAAGRPACPECGRRITRPDRMAAAHEPAADLSAH